MIKLFRNLVIAAFFASSLSAADEIKGMNIVVTSPNTQTQMMAMVIASNVLEQGKDLRIVLCGEAGDLALKDSVSEPQKPANKSPKDLLGMFISKGVDVKVCPLYLPNKGLEKEALTEGIGVAKPAEVTANLLDGSYKNLSY
ncbi:MAG: hypothetical protein GX282_01475 [Campylobacteraceae bacterium]|nr:hypothetical protein [Campylobacteraceae bacterium]